ncbi:MAG: hypothetical protein JO070_04745 [Verrucomicrobia bacterium]|nr:hypothetical protein [Verrucomicrobiota bacterium]
MVSQTPGCRARRSLRRRPGTKCQEWRKKKGSVPEGQDDWVEAAVDSSQIPKLAESCSTSCSCSICGTSAPKREPDPSAIILFHYSDREIGKILEDEHEQEHEHDFLNFGI